MQQLQQACPRILQNKQKAENVRLSIFPSPSRFTSCTAWLSFEPDRNRTAVTQILWLQYIIYITLWSHFQKTYPTSPNLWNILSVSAVDSSTLGMSLRINSPCSQAQCFSVAWDGDFPFIVYLQFYRLWGWTPDAADNMCCKTWGRPPWAPVFCCALIVFNAGAIRPASCSLIFPDTTCLEIANVLI